MASDFFDLTQITMRDLTKTEQQLFDYVVKNMYEVKSMSIREFAAANYMSTTSVFRFAQKLGFAGYTEFINSLLVTTHAQQSKILPNATKSKHPNEYLKNMMEAVRVMSPQQVESVVNLLFNKPNIYILTDSNTHVIGQYVERLFIGLGLHAYFPETAYQTQNLVNRISDKDMLIALSHSGRDAELMDFVQRVFLSAKPYLLSVTKAENNPLASLSDTNFYVFADEVKINGMDLTSNVAILMLIELLVYEYIVTI